MSTRKVVGSRAEVWHGTAVKTSGGLTKSDLFYDAKDGRIKSKAKSSQAKSSPDLIAWRAAVAQARSETRNNGKFPIIKGALLNKARKHYLPLTSHSI